MRRPALAILGLLVLLTVWVWPLPQLGAPPFSAHMAMHMAVVTLAAPLFALSLAGGRLDPVRRAPVLFAAIPASMLELIAVWSWHAPALHHAARTETWAFALEQGTFLLTGFVLWAAALCGGPEQRRSRAIGGVIGLLLTAMHMTLLGALLTLTSRTLYGHHHPGGLLSAEADQQLGGAIMILFGGAAYLAGGLALSRDLLRARALTEERP